MQDDNQGLMPEFQVLHDYLTNMINMATENGGDSEYAYGLRSGLLRARDGIKDSFDWSYRGGISGYVNKLDYDQLCRLIEVA